MNVYRGIGVSNGVAIGKALKINSSFMSFPRRQLKDKREIPKEVDRVRQARLAVEEQLTRIGDQANDILPSEIVSVFDGYRMFLKDKSFIPAIEDKIEKDEINAEWALIYVTADMEKRFNQISDPYIRSRFNDVRQLSEHLMSHLHKEAYFDLTQLKNPVIIVCRDISPVDTFQLVKANILGIATELGGTASHSSILARAMNIPAVVGLQDITMRLLDDELAILDGNSGEIIIKPTEEEVGKKLNKISRFNFHKSRMRKRAGEECALSDGRRINIAANLDFLTEFKDIRELNISSIGLIRTEFLFQREDSLPSEEEQFSLYRHIIEENQHKPITIRTWDIGSDKPLKALSELRGEINPALGLRAIRACLKHEDIFRTQLRAIIRASEIGEIRLLLPMITRMDEVIKSKRLIKEECKNLKISPDNLEIGCMIETPASVFIVDDLLDIVDFISIGSNDLIQYSLAVDRMNEHVADMFAPFHPAILKMLEKVVGSANRMNKHISICGELAADQALQMFLIGIGEVTFSMNPSHVPQTKDVLRKVDTVTCQKIAFQFMNKHSFEESGMYVQELRDKYLDKIE